MSAAAQSVKVYKCTPFILSVAAFYLLSQIPYKGRLWSFNSLFLWSLVEKVQLLYLTMLILTRVSGIFSSFEL